ncbi:hypothetical protein M440DRAFT_4839 [Trichoderma longibrachiatum ATCC 18648]|uniref:Uncharacterized protein n=1 Tax=Trichoderma longibrachiatum ATCC 18648 TaxID=983965 RepID=A0A2T4C454_TRILO|nr:hypothetical protein M440DRAFT_4839 [Trichoderma longibrachiatum ATCC 18648]
MNGNTRERGRTPTWINSSRFEDAPYSHEPIDHLIAAIVFWTIMSIFVVCFNMNCEWLPILLRSASSLSSSRWLAWPWITTSCDLALA